MASTQLKVPVVIAGSIRRLLRFTNRSVELNGVEYENYRCSYVFFIFEAVHTYVRIRNVSLNSDHFFMFKNLYQKGEDLLLNLQFNTFCGSISSQSIEENSETRKENF
jgi:hypothetical protein